MTLLGRGLADPAAWVGQRCVWGPRRSPAYTSTATSISWALGKQVIRRRPPPNSKWESTGEHRRHKPLHFPIGRKGPPGSDNRQRGAFDGGCFESGAVVGKILESTRATSKPTIGPVLFSERPDGSKSCDRRDCAVGCCLLVAQRWWLSLHFQKKPNHESS